MEYSWEIFPFLAAFFVSFCTIFHILSQMRGEPERALLWCVIVLFLPGPGLVLYLLAGVTRYDTLGKRVLLRNMEFSRNKNSAQQRALKEFTDSFASFILPEGEGSPGKTLVHFLSAGNRKKRHRAAPGFFPEMPQRLSGNRITFFHDGRSCYRAMFREISSAKHSIHLQSFIFGHDLIGSLVMRKLRRKALEGVKVVVICDRFGSFRAFFSTFFLKYRNTPNLRVIPFSKGSLFAPWRIQLRNHRKLLIVDGKWAFVGGLNICEGNFRKKSEKEARIREYHCLLRGPGVSNLQYSFLCDYYYAAGKKLRKEEDFLDPAFFPAPEKCGNEILQVIPSGHGFHFEASEKVFLTACASAERSIYILTPYFVPDRSMLTALQMASCRGVKVTLILPRNVDQVFLGYAARRNYEELLQYGVRIFERSGVFLHAKGMLVDSHWCYFGSSNCDSRSFYLNYELDILVEKGQFTLELEEQLKKEISQSNEILLSHWQKRPFWHRLLENAASLAAPLL